MKAVAPFLTLLLAFCMIFSATFYVARASSGSSITTQPVFELNKELQWSRTFEGQLGGSIRQTSDGGFTVCGALESSSETILLKLDSSGNEQTLTSLPGSQRPTSVPLVAQTEDGGYVTAQAPQGGNCFLVKVTSEGIVQWNRTIFDSQSVTLEFNGEFEAIQTSDKGFAVLLSSFPGAGGLFNQLVKTDKDGIIEWTANYTGSSFVAHHLFQTGDGGFLLGGQGGSLGSSLNLVALLRTDSKGTIVWDKRYDNGLVNSAAECNDGGFVIACQSDNGPQSLLIRIDSQGNVIWDISVPNQTSSRYSSSSLQAVVQTSNGYFVAAGSLSESSFGWIVKVSATGSIVWSSIYGGLEGGYYEPESIIQTTEGGFAFAGAITTSSGISNYRIWVAKIGPIPDYAPDTQALTSEWSNTYGPFVDNSVVQTNDGGYAMGGQTGSLGSYSRGGYSYVNITGLLIKVDSLGREEWRKTYLTTGLYSIRNFVQTKDSGYALVGLSGYNVKGVQSIMLVKVDSGGNVQWLQTFTGPGYSGSTSIAQTSDNGFFLASSKQTQNNGNFNAQVLKISQTGNLQWNATFSEDYGSVPSVIAADDGSVLVTYQVNKTAALTSIDLAGHIQWTKTYPDSWLTPYSIAKSFQEGYLLLGTRQVNTDFQQIPWMVKTDSNGNLEWQEAIIVNSGEFNEAIPTSDGGFVLLQDNLWVIKIDSSGNLQWSGKLSLPLNNPPDVVAYSILVGANNSLVVGGQSRNEVWLAKYSISPMTNTPVASNAFPTLTVVVASATIITTAAVVIAYGYRKRRSPKN